LAKRRLSKRLIGVEMTIQQVPKEVLPLIFSRLPSSEEVLKLKKVCKEWNEPVETAAKPLQEREFYEMIDRVSTLFQQMTSRKIQEFVPELKEKLDLRKFSPKGLHDHFKTIPITRICWVDMVCGLSAISEDLFKNKFDVESNEEKFLHLKMQGCAWNGESEKYHFPQKLFAIKEGERTALPLKGKLVIFIATQSSPPGTKFEDAQNSLGLHSLGLRQGIINTSSSYYIWQKDANQDNRK
jgi:hypothetical protein